MIIRFSVPFLLPSFSLRSLFYLFLFVLFLVSSSMLLLSLFLVIVSVSSAVFSVLTGELSKSFMYTIPLVLLNFVSDLPPDPLTI